MGLRPTRDWRWSWPAEVLSDCWSASPSPLMRSMMACGAVSEMSRSARGASSSSSSSAARRRLRRLLPSAPPCRASSSATVFCDRSPALSSLIEAYQKRRSRTRARRVVRPFQPVSRISPPHPLCALILPVRAWPVSHPCGNSHALARARPPSSQRRPPFATSERRRRRRAHPPPNSVHIRQPAPEVGLPDGLSVPGREIVQVEPDLRS